MAFEKLTKLVEDVEALKAKLKQLALAEIKPALQEAITQLSGAIPILKEVYWRQYRPYFNDGDPCYFGIHGIHAKFEGQVSDSDDYSWDDPELGYGSFEEEGLSEGQSTLLNSFADAINMLGDEGGPLELAFDDSVTVIINVKSGKINVEECSHD